MKKIAIVKENLFIDQCRFEKVRELLPEYMLTFYYVDSHELVDERFNLDMIIIGSEPILKYPELIEKYVKSDVKVAVSVNGFSSEQITTLFKMGLQGYFCQEMEPSEFIFAIKMIFNGMQYICPHLSPILLEDYIQVTQKKQERPAGVLTEQEWRVLEEIVKGNKNGIIAENLYISSCTVNNHVSSILKKLHVSDRTNAALLAVKNNWVTL